MKMYSKVLTSAIMYTSGLLLLGLPAATQERGPSTAEERQEALRLIQLIREQPLSEEAKNAREAVLAWLIQIPDISVDGCSDLVPGLSGKKKNYSSELFIHTMFEQAVFYIQNPERDDDKEGAYLAAVEGTLKAYEAIPKEKPKAKHKGLDKLIKMREKDELKGHVEKALKKCK